MPTKAATQSAPQIHWFMCWVYPSAITAAKSPQSLPTPPNAAKCYHNANSRKICRCQIAANLPKGLPMPPNPLSHILMAMESRYDWPELFGVWRINFICQTTSLRLAGGQPAPIMHVEAPILRQNRHPNRQNRQEIAIQSAKIAIKSQFREHFRAKYFTAILAQPRKILPRFACQICQINPMARE